MILMQQIERVENHVALIGPRFLFNLGTHLGMVRVPMPSTCVVSVERLRPPFSWRKLPPPCHLFVFDFEVLSKCWFLNVPELCDNLCFTLGPASQRFPF